MGIDVYLKWNEMKDEDHKAQLGKGFQTDIGDTGYLREAYHGSPYATQMLVPEAFDEKLAGEDEIKTAQKSYSDFVKLAEQKEEANKEPCKVYASY